MEIKLRKLLIGFFILMVFFTVVSRAAASVMVAKVQVDTVKNRELTYELSGTGTIYENAEKYVDLYNGLKIGKLYMKEGQPVEKGEVLFEYDLEEVKEAKSSLDKELNKLKMEYEKTGLTSQNPSSSIDVKSAQLAKQAADEDLKAAKQTLAAKKENVGKDKEEAYKEAVLAFEEVKDSKDAEENKAKRAVSDAESELVELNKPQVTLKEKIDQYKNAVTAGTEDNILKAYTEIFDFYFNGAYKEHQEEIGEAADSLQRAAADLDDIKKKWDKAINEWDQYDSDDAVQKAYYAQLSAKNEEIKNADRAVDDAQKNLNKLTVKDKQLSSALNNYRGDVERNNTDNLEGTYAVLYQVLYDNLKVDEKKISDAGIKLNRAKEDEEQVHKQWEQKLKEATDKKEELAGTVQKIKNKSYDYNEDLKEALNGVQAAKQAQKNAELSLTKALENEQLTEENNQVQDKSRDLDLSMLQLDIDAKQDEINKIEGILSDKGKVSAPVSGVITKSDLVSGSALTGQEKLAIATGGYELSITAGKEDMKYFSAGDELQIDTGGDNGKITTNIENIELPDQDGTVIFTALLPEGTYKAGGSLDYEMQKESSSYPMCITIQALRQDSKGTYVLLVKEKDSVLGKEETAFRLNVTVVSQDDETAAVEASLSEEDPIIISSNKNISEGDRVRIYEME